MLKTTTSIDKKSPSAGYWLRAKPYLQVDTLLCIIFIIVIFFTSNITIIPPPNSPSGETGYFPKSDHLPRNETLQKAKDNFQANWQGSKFKGIANSTKEELNSISPAGDTYFMRYPSQLVKFSEKHLDITKLFQLARISNSYATRRKLLLEIVEKYGLPKIVKYRAYVGISRAAFRSGASASRDQKYYAQQALNLFPNDKSSSPWLSDAYFLLAQSAGGEGRGRIALDNLLAALNLDESFLEAHWYLVRILAEAFISLKGKSPAKLINMTTWMLKSLQSITDLTENKKDFHQLAKNLRPYSGSPYVAFAVGYCYLNAGDMRQARHFLSNISNLSSTNAAMEEIKQKSSKFLAFINSRRTSQ